MHLILFEHCRPSTLEIDKSIFGDYCFTTTEHLRFVNDPHDYGSKDIEQKY